MTWHAFWAVVGVISSLGVMRGVAWLTALYGSQKYSERAMRLLRRRPLPGVETSATLPGPADQASVAPDPASVSSPARGHQMWCTVEPPDPSVQVQGDRLR
jgi:hypothetical protein